MARTDREALEHRLSRILTRGEYSAALALDYIQHVSKSLGADALLALVSLGQRGRGRPPFVRKTYTATIRRIRHNLGVLEKALRLLPRAGTK